MLVTFREKKTKKKTKFRRETYPSIHCEMQPNSTKKTRRNVSKCFLIKKIQTNSTSKLTQELRHPIEIGGNLQQKIQVQVEVPIKKFKIQETLLFRAGVEPAPTIFNRMLYC